MKITVLPHKHIPSPEADDFATRDADAEPCDFDEAFARTWPTDAHFAAYEPLCPPELGGAAVRLASGALTDGVAVRMVALVGDLDDPTAHRTKAPASDEWRAAQLPALIASRLQVYRTRGGYRVLAVLREPVELRTPEDARLWRSTYLGWCEQLERDHGLRLDRSCADWTRLYRLPNVLRDGVEQRARLEGSGFPIVDAYAIPAAPVTAAPTAAIEGAEDRELTERERSELDAAAALIEPSYHTTGDGGAGRNNLALAIGGWLKSVGLPPSAAVHLVGQLPSEEPEKRIADALRAWTKSGAVEGWAALRRLLPASALAAVQAIAVGPSAKKDLLERLAARRERGPATAAVVDTDSPPGRLLSFTEPDAPIEYLCPGLCLAPSEGKISLIAGEPGGGKGPLADHLAVCFALGLKAFDVHECKRVNVMIVDVEGARLTMRRVRRLMRGLERDPAELDGKLFVLDASAENFLDEGFHARVAAFVKKHAIGAVVLDSYTSAMLGTGVEANQPEFAVLAKELGKLDALVLAVAHSNKAAASRGGEPRLSDIAYSGAFAAMAQTAIVVHYPNEKDKTLISVGCARAPEEKFAAFSVRFSDVKGEGKYAGVIPAGADRQRAEAKWGLRVACAAIEPPRALERNELDPTDVVYVRRVLALLEEGPASQRDLIRGGLGRSNERAKGLLVQLSEQGLIRRTRIPSIGPRGIEKDEFTHTIAPRTAANAEAWARWSG